MESERKFFLGQDIRFVVVVGALLADCSRFPGGANLISRDFGVP